MMKSAESAAATSSARCVDCIPTDVHKCLGEPTEFDEVLRLGGPRDDDRSGGPLPDSSRASSPSSTTSSSSCFQVSGSAVLYLLAGCVVLFVFKGYLRVVLVWLESLPIWQGGLVFLLLFTIVSFPMAFGYIVFNVAAGYLYGLALGFLVVSGSVACGSTLAFLVCRHWLKDYVESKLQSAHLKAVMRVVEGRNGWKVVALTRLTPIPFGLQNGLFAITNMTLTRFLTASVVGLLPTQVLNAYMGTSVRSMEDVMADKVNGYLMFLLQVTISVLLMIYVIRRARRELNRACQQQEDVETGNRVLTVEPSLLRVTSHHSLVNLNGKSSGGKFDPYGILKAKQTKHHRSISASAVLARMDVVDDDDDDVH